METILMNDLNWIENRIKEGRSQNEIVILYRRSELHYEIRIVSARDMVTSVSIIPFTTILRVQNLAELTEEQIDVGLAVFEENLLQNAHKVDQFLTRHAMNI